MPPLLTPCPEFIKTHGLKSKRENILYLIVCNLRRQKDAIARGLIKDGYFGGQFTVRMKVGKEHGFYYTPFNAKVFGEIVFYF